jgi:NAD/NADP transhydrogenase alpha subunit
MIIDSNDLSVESLGAEFLTVEIEESGEGTGGYAKEMSKGMFHVKVSRYCAHSGS